MTTLAQNFADIQPCPQHISELLIGYQNADAPFAGLPLVTRTHDSL